MVVERLGAVVESTRETMRDQDFSRISASASTQFIVKRIRADKGTRRRPAADLDRLADEVSPGHQNQLRGLRLPAAAEW